MNATREMTAAAIARTVNHSSQVASRSAASPLVEKGSAISSAVNGGMTKQTAALRTRSAASTAVRFSGSCSFAMCVQPAKITTMKQAVMAWMSGSTAALPSAVPVVTADQ